MSRSRRSCLVAAVLAAGTGHALLLNAPSRDALLLLVCVS